MAARTPDGKPIDVAENRRRMAAGELYYAFTPDLINARRKCAEAVDRFNSAKNASRRRLVELWRDIAEDKTPMPPEAPTAEEDEALFQDEPWIEGPVRSDYGFNVKLGKGSYVNYGAVFLDTCPVRIGARTLCGPNCSFYAGTHPVDPSIRRGVTGPESGRPIVVEEDCWLGGNVIILPGVTIGTGSVVGAGSVVTKDIPPFSIAVGNPAKVIKKVEVSDPTYSQLNTQGAEVLAGEATLKTS